MLESIMALQNTHNILYYENKQLKSGNNNLEIEITEKKLEVEKIKIEFKESQEIVNKMEIEIKQFNERLEGQIKKYSILKEENTRRAEFLNEVIEQNQNMNKIKEISYKVI